jgi:hypothetical protein
MKLITEREDIIHKLLGIWRIDRLGELAEEQSVYFTPLGDLGV